VCPSGVPYGHLLEATRATLAEHRPIPAVARAILMVFQHPALMRLAMFGGRVLRATGIARALAKLPGRPGFAMAMLASTSRERTASSPMPTSNGSRGSVALLTGCVMEGLFTPANRATERVLQANDYSVTSAPGQRCCGALHAHAGDAEGARRLAKANIAAFERADAKYVCVNAAGCGAMMKEYPHLLAEEPEWRARAEKVSATVRDVSELLSAAGPARGGDVPRRVAYDAPCHLMHAQRVTVPPLDVLRAIPSLEMVPLTESDVCCGSAGIYNLVEPDTSDAVLARKLGHIAAARADVIATGNPGCLMQIGAGLVRSGSPTRTVHPVELLDESYAKRVARS
jgi:glycolate oxidase iron-sulfur subunit